MWAAMPSRTAGVPMIAEAARPPASLSRKLRPHFPNPPQSGRMLRYSRSMLEGRIAVTDYTLTSTLGTEIRLGSAFAFISKDAFKNPALGWVQTLIGGPLAARPR